VYRRGAFGDGIIAGVLLSAGARSYTYDNTRQVSSLQTGRGDQWISVAARNFGRGC